MRYLRIIVAAIAIFLALPSCNNARLRNIDREIENLRAEDAKILAELSAAIEELEKSLMAKINATNERLNHDIDAAMQDLMDLIDRKMEENLEYLETELVKRRGECDKVVAENKKNADAVIETLDEVLDEVIIRLNKAVKDGDEETAAQLRAMKSQIESTQETVDGFSAQVAAWQGKIKKWQDSGMYDAMDALDETMEMLEKYNLQAEIDKMEEYVQDFAAVELEGLGKDQMEEIKDMIQEMYNWVDDADYLVSEAQSLSDEMTSNYDDWQSRAEDAYALLDDIVSGLDGSYDEIISALEDALSTADGYKADMDELAGEIQFATGYIGQKNDELEEVMLFLDSLCEEYVGCFHEIEDNATDISDRSADLIDLVEYYKNDHEWLFS